MKPAPKGQKCYVHPTREATAEACIPCAPGGHLFLCDECQTEAGMRGVFEKHKREHRAAWRQMRENSPDSPLHEN